MAHGERASHRPFSGDTTTLGRTRAHVAPRSAAHAATMLSSWARSTAAGIDGLGRTGASSVIGTGLSTRAP